MRSRSVGCRGIVCFLGSGRKTHGSFRLVRIVTACTTVRGKVARPTHHHLARNMVFWRPERVEGSIPGCVEKTRAVSMGFSSEEEEEEEVESVTVASI
jgi:hypothetical protein